MQYADNPTFVLRYYDLVTILLQGRSDCLNSFASPVCSPPLLDRELDALSVSFSCETDGNVVHACGSSSLSATSRVPVIYSTLFRNALGICRFCISRPRRGAYVLSLAPKHCRLSRVPAASMGKCPREWIGRSRPSIGPRNGISGRAQLNSTARDSTCCRPDGEP